MLRSKQWKRALPVGGVILLLLLGGSMFRQFEHSQVYHPTREWDAPPEALNRPFEDVHLDVESHVTVHGWFFPADTNALRRHQAFLVCHGNGGNISHRLDLAQLLLETGANVLLFDYRGYGRSTGTPGEDGTYRDAHAAYAWLRGKGFTPDNILAYGESLGGGVASDLVTREPAGALILQSTFTSMPDLGREIFPFLPVRMLASIHYDTRRRLPNLKIPLLILHSRQDRLIGFHHATNNFAAAPEPKWLWEISGDHNDSLEDRPRFLAGVQRFLQQLDQRRTTPP